MRVVLSLLKEFKVVRELRGSHFRLLKVDLARNALEDLSRQSEEKVDKDKEKLERMMQYGQSPMCRWKLLHDYFGEKMEQERCGSCDNCLHPLDQQIAPPDQLAMLQMLVMAGHDTTVNGIGTMLYRLATVDGLRRRLIEHPRLIPREFNGTR